ncbi:MAG: hypothetical protein CMH60_05240 [Myxococcales bacterium]|nr:hypothetical protein [Myxococcales bacterium]|tara:strand:- start:486 stop:1790 length:1305 start_codon:yes stop_codon:yes gene_type:complete
MTRYKVKPEHLIATEPGSAEKVNDYSQALHEWGQDIDRLREEPEELLYTLIGELNRLGLEIGLASACIRTPHPQLDMLVFRWRPLEIEEIPTKTTSSILGQETSKRIDGVQDIYPLLHGHTDEEMYIKSPFYMAIEANDIIRVSLEETVKNPVPFAILDDLVQRGISDYVVFPLATGQKATVAISLATRREGGFPPEFLAAFHKFLPLLSLSVAYKVERIQFREVLSAYIGQEPASLVLQGQIKRGDLVSTRAAIGFADLRGFTSASEHLPITTLLDLLGAFFENVYAAVYDEGGEILKFMGDGILFIFADENNAGETCDRAMRAIEKLCANLITHNEAKPDLRIRFGCGLHFGEVLYGNIGSPSRLDFTVLGPAVNLTSRIESLTSGAGEQCLVSQDFAKLTSHPLRAVGEFSLKGIEGEQTVYAAESIASAE